MQTHLQFWGPSFSMLLVSMRSCSEGLQHCLLLPPSVAKQHYNIYIFSYLVGAST